MDTVASAISIIVVLLLVITCLIYCLKIIDDSDLGAVKIPE